jgi:hypothetical protein
VDPKFRLPYKSVETGVGQATGRAHARSGFYARIEYTYGKKDNSWWAVTVKLPVLVPVAAWKALAASSWSGQLFKIQLRVKIW